MTRAFPAEYRLSLAQPQPDAGEREQGLVSTGRKGMGQEKEKKKKKKWRLCGIFQLQNTLGRVEKPGTQNSNRGSAGPYPIPPLP